jgi:hypothetical protein
LNLHEAACCPRKSFLEEFESVVVIQDLDGVGKR